MSEMTQTCGCGASYTIDDPREVWTTAAIHELIEFWKDNHQHPRSAGPCMDKLTSGPGHPVHFCSLDAGHAGAHKDDDSGAVWTRTRPSRAVL